MFFNQYLTLAYYPHVESSNYGIEKGIKDKFNIKDYTVMKWEKNLFILNLFDPLHRKLNTDIFKNAAMNSKFIHRVKKYTESYLVNKCRIFIKLSPKRVLPTAIQSIIKAVKN